MNPLKQIKLINFSSHNDERGSLTVVEGGMDIPFELKRIYYLHNVKGNRGEHAHTITEQVLIATSGSFNIDLTDGKNSITYTLDNAGQGLFIPVMVYHKLYNFSPDAVCLVLSSTHYQPTELIKTWKDFRNI